MPVGVLVARDLLRVFLRRFPAVAADENLERSYFSGTNERLFEY